MYKSATRFREATRRKGRKAPGTLLGTGSAEPSWFAKSIKQRKIQEWFAYLDACAAQNKPAYGVPDEIRHAWSRKNG